MRTITTRAIALLLLSACAKEPTGSVGTFGDGESGEGGGSTGGQASTATASDATSMSSGEESTGEPIFDVGSAFDVQLGCPEGESCEGACFFPMHQPCDTGTDDPVAAMGLNCPQEPQVDASMWGAPGARGVIEALGGNDTFSPREGTTMAVLGSGRIADLFHETPQSDNIVNPLWCNTILGGDWEPPAPLPEPLLPQNVGLETCEDNPSLVGTGDCSNTLQDQFDQGGKAYDYSELRMELDVPEGVKGFSFDFAYLTVEYPKYYQTGYNDIFVAWLESESWTGNISFDAMGNPISLNAGFLEFKDDNLDLPEFEGTCMQGHAGTNWLTTTFPLVEGEHIELVLAIFDLQDAKLDSYVLLDNFHWECEKHVDPGTHPAG